LQVMDISDPGNPGLFGSVDTSGLARGVAVSGTTAYVADGHSNLQVIDISDPADPAIIEPIKTKGCAEGVAVSGTTAYVADGYSGLRIVPLPIKIDHFIVNSETNISLTLPASQYAGDYSLGVFNDDENYVMPGAITFGEASPISKAIIVAGGPHSESYYKPLWENTVPCANIAYKTLLWQGYTKENIFYLNPENTDADDDGYLNDMDSDATFENLEYAINTWAKESAAELLIYMTGLSSGVGTFLINSNEVLRAEDLDLWLDELQETMSGRVIFVYDTSFSGSFLPLLAPPEGKERILITSSSEEQAHFLDEGRLSFSYQFWSAIMSGSELYRAFLFARAMMKDVQTPLLDANGNGIGNEYDDFILADDIKIGRGYKAAR